MNVFVTGGTGLVGKVLVRRLVEAGHRVRALSRSDAGDAVLSSLGAEAVRGDLSDVRRWEASLAGIDAVIHAASPLPSWAPWSHFEEGIVDATRALADAAVRAGARRFVQLSSESVLQQSAPLIGVDPSTPAADHPNSFYGRAKKLAEEELLARSELEVMILRPTFIWGEGCAAFDEVVGKVQSGAFVWVDDGAAPFEAVHVETVAATAVAALTRGTPGVPYLVTDDEPITFREFWERIFALRGVESPRRSVPSWLVRPVAASLESLWRLAGARRAPPLTRFELAFAAMPRRYDVRRTWSELGIRPALSRSEGFDRLADSMRALRAA